MNASSPMSRSRKADLPHPSSDGRGADDEPRLWRLRMVDLRLGAPALLAWVMAWLVLADIRWLSQGLAAIGICALAVAVAKHRWRMMAAAAAALAALACTSLQMSAASSGPMAQAATQRSVVTVVAQVSGDPHVLPDAGFGGRSVVAGLTIPGLERGGSGWQTRCRAQILASPDHSDSYSQLVVGQEIRATVRASEPRQASAGMCAELSALAVPEIQGSPGWLDSLINRMRAGLGDAMSLSDAAQAGLVPSLVVGDTSGLDPGLSDDFKDASLTHLTAVSGTNLTLMLVFFMAAARFAGVRGWWLRGLAVMVVGFFVLLCRAEASVLRAAAMGLVALAATGSRGTGVAGLRYLAVAVWLVIMLDPWLAHSWGFALSVAATAGILWWAGPWQQAMRAWAPGWLAESLCVPLAAQLATQPLITILSGQISVVGVVANMAAAPFVGPVTVLGLVAALVSPIAGWLALPLGWVAGACVQPIILVARLAAAVPAAVMSWPLSPVSIALLSIFCLVIAVILGRVIAHRLMSALLAVMVVAACFWRPPAPGWPADWQIMSCDVGQGDATLVRTAAHEAILVDTGPDPEAMAACLSTAKVQRISLLVPTHFHADHIGGLEAVLEDIPVDRALLNPLASPSGTAANVHARFADQGITTEFAAAGQQFAVGTQIWRTLAAGDGDAVGATDRVTKTDAQENDSSIVGHVSGAGPSIVVTGDLEPAGQRRAMSQVAAELPCDVLKVPHHGSGRQDEEFLAATHARIALVSVGKDNSYGHPAAKTLAVLVSHGMTIARTDEQGAIALTSAGQARLTMVSQR